MRSLPPAERETAGIPINAAKFAFVAPCLRADDEGASSPQRLSFPAGASAELLSAAKCLLECGGYVYVDKVRPERLLINC